ncbi:MAG: GNAT family N-acetyltransferase [Planctomycetota bacterium]|jgi:RimJ/RimL family protein N-acetyltransferase|nr:GNAT family N-acetyltransferase [Planctomycetota bacterium]
MRTTDGEVGLRLYRAGDRDRLVAIADNPNVARTLADRFPHPYAREDAENWLARVKTETRPCNMAIEWRGELVGGIGIEPMADVHSGTAELGYWLGEPYWGKGIATRAAGLIISYAFDELLFIRLQASVFAGNPASCRVLEKNGFVREGVLRKHIRKNGRIRDAFLYARLRSPG